MCGISVTRYTICGCVKNFISGSIVRCKYFRRKEDRCNGHLDAMRTVGHECGRCLKHSHFGNQPPPEIIMQREKRQEL